MSLADRMRGGGSVPAPVVQQVQPVYQRPNVVVDLPRRAAPVVQRQRQFGAEPAPVRVVNPVALPLQRMAQPQERNLFAPVPVLGNLLGEVAQRKPSAASVVANALANVSQPMTMQQRVLAGQQAIQNQAFDQQIQLTKDVAGPGYANESTEDARYDEQAGAIDQLRQRAQAVQPFVPPAGPPPQPTYNLLSSANAGSKPTYDPLSGTKTGTTKPQPYGFANAGPVISHTSGDAMAGVGEPSRTPEQEAQDFDLQMQITKLQSHLMNDPAHTSAYDLWRLQAMQDQLDQFRGTQRVSATNPNSGIAPALDAAEGAVSYDFGSPISNALKEYGGKAIAAFAETPQGKLAFEFLNALNKPYEWNTENSAGVWYAVATNQTPGYADNPLGDIMNMIPGSEYIALAPDVAAATILYAAKPEIKDGVIEAYENGYSSPSYIKTAEAAGIDWHAQPQFTGDQAVHEYLIGLTDDWPAPLRDVFRLAENVVMDPLTYAFAPAAAGEKAAVIGKAIATADDSGIVTRGLGRGLQVAGHGVELAARAPDAPFELIGHGWGRWRGAGHGMPGAFELSSDQQVVDAHAAAVHADELIRKNTDADSGNIPSAETVQADLDRAQAAATPGPSTLTDAEQAADAVDGPVSPQPRVLRPEDEGGIGESPSEVTHSTIRAAEAGEEPAVDLPTRPAATGAEAQTPEIEPQRVSPAARDESPASATPQSVVTAEQIPPEFPAIQTAVARQGTRPDLTGVTPGEHAFTPVYGGGGVQDAAITQAVQTGDLDLMAQVELLAEEVDSVANKLTDDPYYRPLNNGGARIDGYQVVPGLNTAQERAIRMALPPSRRVNMNVFNQLAGMTKAVLEKTAALKFFAEDYTPLYRKYLGEAPINTGESLYSWYLSPEGTTGRLRPIQYSMERYVTTSSDDYAQQLLDSIFTHDFGNNILNITHGDKPYLVGIPEQYRADVTQTLQDARKTFQRYATASDEEFDALLRQRETPTAKPSSAVQMEGGLKEQSKKAAKMVDGWNKAAEPKVGKSRLPRVLETRESGDAALLPVVTVDGFGGPVEGSIIRISDRFPAMSTEQSPSRALAFLDESIPIENLDELYFLSDTDSWVGLGRNRGVSLSFDPTKIRGQVTEEGFPATASQPAFSYLIGREADPNVYRDALRSVTIDPRRVKGRAGELIAELERRGWVQEMTPDGNLRYISSVNERPATLTPADAWIAKKASERKGSRGGLRFAEMAPTGSVVDHLTDALSKEGGWLGSKMQRAQRVADDSFVENVASPELALWNQTGRATREQTEYLNKPIDWHPPGTPNQPGLWEPQQWTMIDAITWGMDRKVTDPTFDYGAFLDRLGEIHAGIPPQLTPAEKKTAIRIARENGQVPPEFKTTTAERLQSHTVVRGYDKYLSGIRQLSLFGPISGTAGFIGDVIGNAWSAIVNGHFGTAVDVVNPWNTGQAAKTFRGYSRNAHQAADAMLEPFLRETGQLMPADLYPANTLREVPVSGKPFVNQALEGRNMVVRASGNILTVPAIKDARTATDLVGRTSVAKRVAQDAIRTDALPAFRRLIAKHAGEANVDQIVKDILAQAEGKASNANVSWKGFFSPEDVRTATEGTPYSNNLARGWQSELNKAIEKGQLEQKRIYFSYKNTNADEAIGSIMMFHYWQTRASYMHLRAALRNPVLLNGYYKLWQELKSRSEDNGLGYMGPMWKFMTSPSGVYAAIDPIGILLPTTLLDMQDQEGSKLRVLQNQLNPVIGAALAVAGVTDNVPNVTGLRTTERWLINMGNFLTAEGVDVAKVPLLGKVWDNNTMQLTMPIDETIKTLLEGINGWAESKGIPVADFAPFDRGPNEQDQLNTWVLKGVEGKWGPMDPNATSGPWGPNGQAWKDLDDAIDALHTGMPNEIADAAEQHYASEGLIAALASPFIPGGVITRSEYRDQQIAGNAADDPAASLNRDIAKAADPTWTTMQQQWNSIGTPEQQYVYDTYMTIVSHPEDLRGLTTRLPNGSLAVIPTSGIKDMTDDERQALAQKWLVDNPGYEDAMLYVQSAQADFKTKYPQMADFKEYQKAAYAEDTGGIRTFRTELAKTNPNFKAEMDSYAAFLKGQGVTGAQLETKLDSWAGSPNGFLAAMGLPINNGDKPLPVYDPTKNPYANPALAGMAPGAGGGSGGSSSGSSTITKGADGKLYNQDGQMVNQQGKPINEAGQVIDDYWYPDKVSQRLADQVAKYDSVNQDMEARFGDNWNTQTGYWEKWADSASERKKLGIYDIPYVLPSTSDLMRDFESWHYDNPNKTLEDWFTYLMGAPGFGIAADPEASLGYGAPQATGLSSRMIGGQGSTGNVDPKSWLWSVLNNATGYQPDDTTQ